LLNSFVFFFTSGISCKWPFSNRRLRLQEDFKTLTANSSEGNDISTDPDGTHTWKEIDHGIERPEVEMNRCVEPIEIKTDGI